MALVRPRLCFVCAAEAVSQCVRCKAGYYCSRRCQKKHWAASHKRRCITAAERAAFNTPQRRDRLWQAARRNNVAVARDLTLRGVDVNCRDLKTGCTPLYVAAAHGAIAIVKDLLDAGADKELTDKNGTYPLHIAAMNGHTAVARADRRRRRNGPRAQRRLRHPAARGGHERP